MQVSRNQELETIVRHTWQDYHSGNKAALSDFYSNVMPFCLRVSSKTCGKYINEFDEEASITRLALIEAFEKYNPQRGSILFYLAQVVRSRIIDYQRREKRRPIPIASFPEKQYGESTKIKENQVEEILDDISRQEEIHTFRTLLDEFNIDFMDLVDNGPKQARARDKAHAIAWLIAGDQEVISLLLKNKTIPLKLLESRYAVNRKTVDRYRKYIIASVLVAVYDLPILKTYIEPQGKENNNG